MSSALMPSLLVNSAFAIATIAFLVRDILWLRLLTIVGYSVFVVLHSTRADGPAWNFLIWYAALMTINGGHAAWLIYERQLVKLNDEECRLRDLVFPSLDPFAVKRLMRAGIWQDVPAGDVLTRKGQRPDQIYLVAAGEAVVSDGDQVIARLGRGQFIGEIAFLRHAEATADTRVARDGDRATLRCLAWDEQNLRRRLARDQTMRIVLYAAIGADLASKIADNNVRVTRAAECAMASTAG